MTDQILSEILEEPEAVRKSIALGRKTYRAVAETLAASGCSRIYAVGCGSSYFAGILARYALEQFTHIPTIAASAVDFSTYSLESVDKKAAVIGISQSGESFETVEALEKCRGRAGLLLALTNNRDSRLSGIADASILTEAGPEEASGTKTVLAQMLAAYQFALELAAVLGSHPQDELVRLQRELDGAHELTAQLQADTASIAAVVDYLKDVDNLYVVAAGPFFPLGLQMTNTAREIARVHCQAFDVTEFRHGPLEILRAGTFLMLLSNSHSPLAANMVQLGRLARRAGASVSVVTDPRDTALRDLADHYYLVPEASEYLGAVLYLAGLHLVLYHWSRAKGLDPNHFENIVKTWTQAF